MHLTRFARGVHLKGRGSCVPQERPALAEMTAFGWIVLAEVDEDVREICIRECFVISKEVVPFQYLEEVDLVLYGI